MRLMGVLTEIGVMRRRCIVVVLWCVWWCGATAAASCPSLCSCRGPASGGPAEPGELLPSPPPPAAGEPLRLRCGGGPAQITELKEIDFTNIWGSVVSLNMSGNAISTLSRELHLPNLQKLDLSRNQINLIETDAFYNVTRLQRLDLSYNQIGAVAREMFKGLAALERLLLAHNRLAALAPGTFDHLVALKQLDITENRLVCDCALLWLGEWLRGSGARLAGSPKCRAPEPLAGKSVRKLRIFLDLAACGALPAPALRLRPARDQLVFRGDALALSCAAPFASAAHPYRLEWTRAAHEPCDVNVTSSDMLEEGAAETVARLANVSAAHAGTWTCVYEDDERARLEASVELVVVSNDTRYCATDYTSDNKGLYSWPTLLPNRTASVPCRSGSGAATRACAGAGRWAAPDTGACAYLSNVTKLLQQFALLEPARVGLAARNASARLAALVRERTSPLRQLDDPDDVMFVARAVDNYLRYVHEEKDLGSALLDVISAVMNAGAAVMAAAEEQHGACSMLLRAATTIATLHTDKQKSNLAVESFPLRAGFSGATCVWYSPAPGAGAGVTSPAPRLHCTTTNRTVSRLLTFADAVVHASVQIPGSLTLALDAAASPAPTLVVGVFLDAALFPLLPRPEPPDPHRPKDYYGRSTRREDTGLEITSPVVSVRLENGSLARELVEPVIATVRAAGAGCGAAPACAVWDPRTRRWQYNDTECLVLHVSGCTAILQLSRPGTAALLARAERGIYGARTTGARFKVSHPAVYVGSLLLVGCLAACLLTYAVAFPRVAMPRRAKHAHVNTWLAVAALAFLYTLGIYQTEDARLCRALGLGIHYLTLCCLLWMCVAADVLRSSAARRLEPPRAPAPDEPPRPVLGLYLAGWGLALIVCGISGAVNLQEYAGYAQCFLSSAPALGALLVPAALLLLCAAVLLLLVRRATRAAGDGDGTEGTQATEHVELEWERAAPTPALDALDASLRSLDSDAEDAERAPAVQLRAQVIVLALFLAAWLGGAVAVYRPLPAYLPYQEDICSILYAVAATVLGTFVLFFYGIARSDVRAQWALVPCSLRAPRRGRSVSDSGAARARARAPAPAPRSRSGSRGSGRPGSKADEAAHKAAAELNGHADGDAKLPNGKSINLVVLHRRQYRSDDSALTADERSVGPEAFYNPNQMNVAKKFFKRQRQHEKRTRLELPPRRELADSRRSLPSAGAAPSAEPAAEPEPPRPTVNVYTNVPETPEPQHHVGTRSVSQQCSLEYSSASASEPAPPTPARAAEPGLDDVTDTESFGRYVDYLRPAPEPAPAPAAAADAPPDDARSTDASEQGFENESDIYCPNYQMSEVSIRSHGLYAPSPSSMCPNELGLSAEDVSHADSRYVNLARAHSPASSASDLDELYTRITARAEPGTLRRRAGTDAAVSSDVTLRADSDADAAAATDTDARAETAV